VKGSDVTQATNLDTKEAAKEEKANLDREEVKL
jgi:hypothetical protein